MRMSLPPHKRLDNCLKDTLRAEIASIMNPRIKWTFQDYVKVLEEAGFRRIDYAEGKEYEGLIIATK